jgi:hypothetical protein
MSETKILTIQEAMEITQDIPEIFAQILDFFDAEVEFVELGVKGDQIIVREVEKSNPTVSSVHVPSTDWNKDNLLLAKAMDEEKRYTLAPWYVPDVLDAHDEWTDKEEVQKAFWDYLKRDDRSIRLQHNMDITAGEWVEGLTWPHAVTVPIKHPEGDTEVTFPAGTPFLGVIWEPWAWQLIKDGEIRGLSIGGRGRRMEADPEDYDYDPMGKVSFTKMIRSEGGKYVVYSDDGSRSFGTYDTKEEAEERLRQIEYFAKADFKTGDFVSWNSSGGRARGKIERIEIDGQIKVPDSSFTITGTNEEPAALITVWREDSDGWNETDRKVGHKLDALTPIDALQKAETFKPPQAVIDNAKRALEWISEGEAGSGFTGVGRRRASQLANGEAVSLETVKRIYSFLSRHEGDSKAEGFERGEKNYPSAGRVAWDAWGGDEAMTWSRRISERFAKHLPGQHDQSSHAGGKRKVVDLVADQSPKAERSEGAIKSAEDIRKRSEKLEPEITESMMGIADEYGGKFVQLNQRLKTTDSLARKIDNIAKNEGKSTDEAASTIADSIRYTMTVPPSDYTAATSDLITKFESQGYDVEAKNYWQQGDSYQGMNMKLRKDGITTEFQMHTPESYKIKTKELHPVYDVFRVAPKGSAARKSAYQQMVDIAAKIPLPANYDQLLGLGILVMQTIDTV